MRNKKLLPERLRISKILWRQQTATHVWVVERDFREYPDFSGKIILTFVWIYWTASTRLCSMSALLPLGTINVASITSNALTPVVTAALANDTGSSLSDGITN